MKLLEKKNNEIFYNGVSLTDLAKKYGTPLKVTFLDVIREHVKGLKMSFDKAIANNNYSGKFIYLNANKANYGKEEIEASFMESDGLETSSYYDMLLTHKLFELHDEFKNKIIMNNGYKQIDYISAIVDCFNKGYDITNIIDDVNEYETLKKLNIPMKVGLRIHLAAQYNEHEDEPRNDRFGLMDDEINYILNDIKNTKLILTTIHFHQRGFDYEEDKFKINFVKGFNYYVKASKMYDSVVNYDMGGGTPLPVDHNFDYDKWANYVISLLKELSKENGVKEPNLVSENGKYSQKDGTLNIYKVVGRKNTDEYPWLLINGSPLIAMPERYALGEPIPVMALNELDKKTIKARLAGITCDCDDVLPIMELPETNNDLFVGLIGTGSYQNSMNGKGGVHHCLLPEERDVIVYTLDGKLISEVRNELQSIDDIFKLMHIK